MVSGGLAWCILPVVGLLKHTIILQGFLYLHLKGTMMLFFFFLFFIRQVAYPPQVVPFCSSLSKNDIYSFIEKGNARVLLLKAAILIFHVRLIWIDL